MFRKSTIFYLINLIFANTLLLGSSKIICKFWIKLLEVKYQELNTTNKETTFCKKLFLSFLPKDYKEKSDQKQLQLVINTIYKYLAKLVIL